MHHMLSRASISFDLIRRIAPWIVLHFITNVLYRISNSLYSYRRACQGTPLSVVLTPNPNPNLDVDLFLARVCADRKRLRLGSGLRLGPGRY